MYWVGAPSKRNRAFDMPHVPFAFEFESEWLNDNSVTKQLPNYHSLDLEMSVKWLKGNCFVSELPFDCLTDFSKSDKL